MIAAVGGALLCVFYLLLFWWLGAPGHRLLWFVVGVVLALSVAASFAQGLGYASLAYEAPGMLVADALVLVAVRLVLKQAGERRALTARLAVAVVILLAQCVIALV